jgi:POT family proton-dependent oligopeptide transporter
MRSDDFWESVKPSRLGQAKPAWMTFDDVWVDEVRRGFKACTVFLWIPIYWLAYNQMTTNLISQAATMELHGAPNDLINNIDPIALVIFIPIVDLFLYPGLERMGIRFTPLKRIAWGFGLSSASMVASCVTQYYVYKLGPCGKYPSSTDCVGPAPINVWVQTIPYLLIAFSEIFTSITCLEYAFTKAPKNMRSVVTAVFLFMSAVSYAISEAFVSISADPWLVWNYMIISILAAVAGAGFWLAHRKLDKEEDKLNFIPESSFKGRKVSHEGQAA